MERSAFERFCEEWISRGALDFTRKSHFEEMSPLLEPHAEVVTVYKDSFHCLTGNVYYPKKETTDRLGKAAGISFSADKVRVEQSPDGGWIGTAYPQELGPDGKLITWAPASYEFNPADRAEEELLRKSIKDRTAEPSGAVLKLKTLEYKKVALRRADTGARVAAIISAIGMPTGLKDLFSQNDTPDAVRYFLFSRVIVNTKNELVMAKALDSMFANTALLAGPSVAAALITGPAETLRNCSDDGGFEDSADPEPDLNAADLAGAAAAFGDPNGVETPRSKLKAIAEKYRGNLSDRGNGKIAAALASDASDEVLLHLYEQARDFLAGKGITI